MMGFRKGWVASLFIRSVVLLFILPVIVMLYRSFSNLQSWPLLLSKDFTWRHWQVVFYQNPMTFKAIWTSVEIGLAAIFLNVLIGVPAADALARYSFRGEKVIEAVLFAPIVVPPLIVLTGIHLTFIRWGLTEHIGGVVLAHLIPTMPYMIRALKVSYEHLGFELEDQARVLGANSLNRFFYVVFPQLLPGMIAGASLTLLISLSQYIITVLIGGGHVVTLTLLMVPYLSGGNQGVGAVFALIFAAVAIGLMILMDNVLKRYYHHKGL